MRTIYKTLAEVRVLHEYYLTETSGETVFDSVTQADKVLFLEKFFTTNRPKIEGDVAFEIPPAYADTFKKNRLHLIPTYSGFRILIEVDEVPDSNNGIRYRPVAGLSPTDKIAIGIRSKGNGLRDITNERISRPFPSIYLFRNSDSANSMSFPTLSAPIPEYSTVHTYEQGELSLNTLGEVQSFFSDQDGNEQWSTLAGTGFANERDRILLPSRFTYTFPKNSTGTGATEAEFRLLDLNDNEVQTLVTTVPEYGKVNLNFNGTSVEPLKRYRLEVDSPRMRSTHEVAFFEAEQGSLNYWGVVLLVPRVQSEEFNLIDDDGFIRLRKNPDGTESKPEFFEIRIKSRPTFWRYANEHGRKIKTNASLDDYLIHDDENGVMTSLQMRYASVSPKVFSGNGNTRHLPQPLSYSDLRLETNRIVTEIRVPRSDLFDV